MGTSQRQDVRTFNIRESRRENHSELESDRRTPTDIYGMSVALRRNVNLGVLFCGNLDFGDDPLMRRGGVGIVGLGCLELRYPRQNHLKLVPGHYS